jgi:HEPN domain-containing protein
MTERDALDVARVLLKKARQDEALVRKIGSDTDIADEMAGFHCQQAVEKQIKAVLTAHEIPYKKSHELSYLAALIDEKEIDTPAALEQADTLTDWAVEFRYAGEEPPALNRDAALTLVVQLREWAEAQVAAVADTRKVESGQPPPTDPCPDQTPAASS